MPNFNDSFNKIRETEKRIEDSTRYVVKKSVDGVAYEMENAPKQIKKFWGNLGPGFTTGASDDDPSGIATYSQAGASFGLGFTWSAIFTFPLMSIVQDMCARIGIVTGRGLASNIKSHYSKSILYVCTLLLIGANIFNIGANLGAMAKSFQLLFSFIDFWFLVIFFGSLSLILQVYTTYENYAKYLKYLALILLSYVVTVLFINVEWGAVVRSIIYPQIEFSKEYIVMLCAILGTTISPYLFFWQTSQEVEEKVLRHSVSQTVQAVGLDAKDGVVIEKESLSILLPEEAVVLETEEEVEKEIKKMKVDVWTGMLMSNIVMFFIIVVCASTLNASGILNINDASDAANALRPLAGDYAFLLFAIGIIGTGMLAIPVLAGSSAYAVSESFGWRSGLYKKLKEAYAFYGVIAMAIIVGIILNFVGLDPIKALIYSAVLNGIIAPVILFLIVSISSKESVMGKYKNSTLSKSVGWVTVFLMSISAISAIYVIFQ
jgi:NRAMP (natural resistance-associated macrophage protein)-like metal ion transporter